MSDTDKTRPAWVQVADPHNRGWLEAYHDHRHGVCDIVDARLGTGWHGRGYCHYWPSTVAAHAGVYPRFSRCVRVYRRKRTRRARTEWRRLRRELGKMTRVDLLDYELISYQHRHNALRDAY